jgi:acetyl esterase/lipase
VQPSHFLLLGTLLGAAAPPSAHLAGIDVHRDIPYARDGRARTLDVYRATGPGLRPVLLFLHGGGWIGGSKNDAFPELYPAPRAGARRWPSMLPFLSRGLAVVTLDYRLAAEASAPAAVDDCRRGLDWIVAHGAAYGLDAARVVTIGPSAGGHLALMVAFAPRSPVVGVVDLYGITDVGALLVKPTPRVWAVEWIGPQPSPATRAREVSPITLVRPGLPPVLIVHSVADAEVPYEQSLRLVDALRGAGVSIDLLRFENTPHGFFDDAELARLEGAILAFLARLGVTTTHSPG